MIRSRVSKKLWDLCLTYVTDTHPLTDHPIYKLGFRNPYEILTGETPDISKLVEYDWYAPVWYLDPGYFLGDDLKLGRWIGVDQNVGQSLLYNILL